MNYDGKADREKYEWDCCNGNPFLFVTVKSLTYRLMFNGDKVQKE
jgi:hypothetical protein